MEKFKEIVTVINETTGEVLAETASLYSKDIITNKDNVSLSLKERYTKLFHRKIPKFKNVMFELYFHRLAYRISYGSNVICSEKSRYRTPMNDQEIMEYLGIGVSAFNKFIAEMVRKEYVLRIKGNGNAYIFNPAYCMNGQTINKTTFELFSKNKDFIEFLPMTARKDIMNNFGVDIVAMKQSLLSKSGSKNVN